MNQAFRQPWEEIIETRGFGSPLLQIPLILWRGQVLGQVPILVLFFWFAVVLKHHKYCCRLWTEHLFFWQSFSVRKHKKQIALDLQKEAVENTDSLHCLTQCLHPVASWQASDWRHSTCIQVQFRSYWSSIPLSLDSPRAKGLIAVTIRLLNCDAVNILGMGSPILTVLEQAGRLACAASNTGLTSAGAHPRAKGCMYLRVSPSHPYEAA